MTAALFYDKEPQGLQGEALVVANCLVVREQSDGRGGGWISLDPLRSTLIPRSL